MKKLFTAADKKWSTWVFERRIARARRRPSVPLIRRLAIRLIASNRTDEAEALLGLALARAPGSLALLEQLAFCAHNSGRYREAFERWRGIAALRPDLPMSWCGISANARELGLRKEASSAIDEAMRRFPDDIIVLTEAARTREFCGAHVEAAELWRRVITHPCADEHWHLALARNLMAVERYDEAEAVLVALHSPHEFGSAEVRRTVARQWCEAAAIVSGTDFVRFARHAVEALRFGEQAYAITHVVEATDDLVAAREALKRLVEREPGDLEARDCYFRILMRAELLDEAEQQVKIVSTIMPNPERAAFWQATIAIRKQDWRTAFASASAFAEMVPENLEAAYLLDRVRWVWQLEEEERARNVTRVVPIAPALCDEPETRQLFLRFESFGQDCEFGTIQRRYGGEPLGLLRWTDTNAVSLMAALQARFAGIGDPENTELVIGSIGEIQIRDKRWNLAMHTFLYENEVSLATLHPKMCRRTAYLRDKLLEDLGTGRKTIVFKSDVPDMRELVALHDALSAYGPNRLLNVRMAPGTRDVRGGEPGTVHEIRPGLCVGHLSRVGQLDNIVFDEWIKVCRGVERLWLAADANAFPMETAVPHMNTVFAASDYALGERCSEAARL